jgi:hypothetical protein
MPLHNAGRTLLFRYHVPSWSGQFHDAFVTLQKVTRSLRESQMRSFVRVCVCARRQRQALVLLPQKLTQRLSLILEERILPPETYISRSENASAAGMQLIPTFGSELTRTQQESCFRLHKARHCIAMRTRVEVAKITCVMSLRRRWLLDTVSQASWSTFARL